jgi:hypothetical protein
MFVPPYPALLSALKTSKGELAETGTVEVPRELLEMLLRCILSMSSFDEPDYLSAHPDVRDAVRRRQHKSGRSHFLMYGYFEDRLGGSAMVDEEWYLSEYPDVAEAIAKETVSSATEHYVTAGMFEWRMPNAEAKADLALWKRALGADV